MLLLLRSLFWTILIPGVVTIYIPSLILGRIALPDTWRLLQWIAVPAGGMGATILLHCIVSFAVIGRGTLSPADAPQHLVVRGLYRYVRNPMYCGVLAMLLAEAAFFESVALLEYTLVWFAVVHLFVILYEEPALRRQFGNSYDQYTRNVHRWLPGEPYDAVP